MNQTCVICGRPGTIESSPGVFFCAACALRALDTAAARSRAVVERTPKATTVRARITVADRDRLEAAAADHFDGNYSELVRTPIVRLLDALDAGASA